MGDMMQFPDSVDEFMEKYKIVDTEQVYTNGAELVPIFRMNQWFEHLPSAQPERKKGKWIPGREIAREMCGDAVTEIFYENFNCSVCGYSIQYIPLSNFCPNCGADMRREDNA